MVIYIPITKAFPIKSFAVYGTCGGKPKILMNQIFPSYFINVFPMKPTVTLSKFTHHQNLPCQSFAPNLDIRGLPVKHFYNPVIIDCKHTYICITACNHKAYISNLHITGCPSEYYIYANAIHTL